MARSIQLVFSVLPGLKPHDTRSCHSVCEMEYVTIPKKELNTEHDIVLYLSRGGVCWNPRLILLGTFGTYVVYRRRCDPDLTLKMDIVGKYIMNGATGSCV